MARGSEERDLQGGGGEKGTESGEPRAGEGDLLILGMSLRALVRAEPPSLRPPWTLTDLTS